MITMLSTLIQLLWLYSAGKIKLVLHNNTLITSLGFCYHQSKRKNKWNHGKSSYMTESDTYSLKIVLTVFEDVKILDLVLL